MEFKGPLGVKRFTSIGPFVEQNKSHRDFSQDMTRQEFIEQCQRGKAAQNFSKGFIESVTDSEEAAEQILAGDADEELERDFCEGIADKLDF